MYGAGAGRPDIGGERTTAPEYCSWRYSNGTLDARLWGHATSASGGEDAGCPFPGWHARLCDPEWGNRCLSSPRDCRESGCGSRSFDDPERRSEIDTLLGTGLDRGSSTLILGPAGCGKTTLSSQFLIAALGRDEPAVCFLFEESRETFLQRASGLGMDFAPYLASGLFELVQIDPAEVSPGEFASRIACEVETRNARIIVIDSVNGYINAMPNERFLLIQLHELLAYLGQKNIVTILVMAQHGMLGSSMQSPVDVSFLADTVILLRFFEALGEIRLALSVVKKRRSGHERTIREMRLGPGGVLVGAPLREFEGVLTGVPRYNGAIAPLLEPGNERRAGND